jgi:hypothetical protein
MTLVDDDACRRFLTERLAQLTSGDRVSLPFQAGVGVFHRGMETRFHRMQGDRVRMVKISDTTHEIRFGTNRVVSVDYAPDSLLNRLLTCNTFTAQAVADWAPELDFDEEIAPLLTRLVQEGIIVPEDLA